MSGRHSPKGTFKLLCAFGRKVSCVYLVEETGLISVINVVDHNFSLINVTYIKTQVMSTLSSIVKVNITYRYKDKNLSVQYVSHDKTCIIVFKYLSFHSSHCNAKTLFSKLPLKRASSKNSVFAGKRDCFGVS